MQLVRTAFWLAVAAALVAVADVVLTLLGRHTFTANVAEFGWAVNEQPPHDGIRQRFVFCLVVAALVAAAAIGAAALITRPRPASRLGVLCCLPLAVLLDSFTVIYAPESAGSDGGATPQEQAAAAAAFDRLFPLWYTGGHTIAVVALAALTVALVLVLRKPAVMEYFEFSDADGLRAGLLPGRARG
ncbi:hypothetical protein KZZ52_32370 [Dactylosporangium sp. AC04546]|uniref:hypothetical protein n=1 Tax=Dactylosporangium sp. AC04546 TaxID=2862460 RepID=UPI001EDE0C1E|nr:hypothetical protein [Dactylosporangium sp. AC04546]WVK78687.1 hypothetical protein KZZ52_32370 [Dactylosporangium sp. AC04546]